MASTGSTHRILVADDEPMVRRLIQDVLSREGHVVEACADGVELLERHEVGRYSLIITDCAMPRKTGIEAVRELRARGVKTPVIFVTSTLFDEARELCIGLEGITVLPKPFALADLKAAVRDARPTITT